MRRVDRLRREVRAGVGLEKMAEMLYQMAHDESIPERDRVAAAREWRMVARDLGAQTKPQGGVKDDLAARRQARRRASG